MNFTLASEEAVLDRVVLPAFEPPSFAFNDQPPAYPKTPAEFFALNFPASIKKYGSAVLERRRVFNDGSHKVTPLALNEDALAAILGAKQCGETVYHKFEMQFYQRDPSATYFIPVDAEDLKLVLSQLLLKCATGMPSAVEIQRLVIEFRGDEILERVIQRAKAVLAVDEEYFSPEGSNARNPATTPKESVRLFVDAGMGVDEGACLTFQDCFDGYQQFCRDQKLPSVPRNQFKAAISPHIQRRFNRGVRNDLHRFNADKCTGWYGVRLVHPS